MSLAKRYFLVYACGMNLQEIYEMEGRAGLQRLAEATGAHPQYLWQCATRWRGKRPSPGLALRLVEADQRLTLEDIYRQT